MIESGIFSVDVDEALKVTDLDLESTTPFLDQDDMGLSLTPDDSTWPYQSNQENDQLPKPDKDTAATSHEPLNSSIKRFVRPESVGKGSPGFTYSRPEIKVPDLRRNIGGKVHDPTVKKTHIAEPVVNTNQMAYQQGNTQLAQVLPTEEAASESCEIRSGLHLTVLSSLQAASAKPIEPIEPSAGKPNEQGDRPTSVHVTKQTSPREPEPPALKHGKASSNGSLNNHHVAKTNSPLQGPTDDTDLTPPHDIHNISRAGTLADVSNSRVTGKAVPRKKLLHLIERQGPGHAASPMLKVQEAGRIGKRNAKRQLHAPSVRPTVESDPCVPDQVEILQILAFRAKQERDAQQVMASKFEAQRKQLERMKAEYVDLEAQLNQGLERENAQKAELDKFKNLLSGLRGKAKKLDDYIKGLSNDHNKLRDDAISLRQHQESLQDDRRVIQTALANTRNSLQSVLTIDKGALSEARLQLGNLQKVINQQHSQLMDKSDLLELERKRVRTLEGELSRIASSQERIVESMRYDQRELLNSVQALLNRHQKAVQAEGAKSAIPPGALKRCVELLEQVHCRKNVQPGELHRLGECLQEQIRSITTTMEDAKEKFGGHQEIVTSLLTRFDSLMAGFKSQEQLAEKVAQLREAESILRERTQAKDNSMVILQQQIVDLQNRESIHLQSISDLHVKLNTPIAPSENPRLLQQVNELECRNRDLRQEASGLQTTIDSLTEQIKTQDEKYAAAVASVRQGEAAMQEVKAFTAKAEQAKAEFEARAVMEHEKLRQELSKASIEEKRSMAREHANALYQVQHQLSNSRDNSVKIEGKLKDAMRAQEEQAQALNALRAQVGQYDYEKKENEKSITHLETQLQEATQNGLSKDADIQNLEEANNVLGKQKTEVLVQRDEAVHRLASYIADTASKHTKVLEQINTICDKNDKTATPATSIENALKNLAQYVDMLRGDSQATIVATHDPPLDQPQDQLQELLFSSEPGSASRRNRSDGLEDVALVAQDRNTLTQADESAATSTPHVARPRAPSLLRHTPFRETLQESHVEETTTVRSVKRTTSNFGLAVAPSHADSPSRRGTALPALASFADIHRNSEQSIQESPAPENMKDFFPPTPVLPAWPRSMAQPNEPLAKNTPSTSGAPKEREIPSILRRPTSSVIRGDLATSPTPIQTAHSRSKRRVETSLSKTRKTLETTETVKESAPQKGILKPSRMSKRSATDASLETPIQSSRKRSGAPGSSLVSSQSRESQGGTMPKVAGKKGTARRGSRTDKYQERFTKGV